jgi:hypothetical protein
MTLARIGNRTINLALIVEFIDLDGPENRVELVLLTGATIALEGEAADAIRRFISRNAMDLLAAEPDPAAPGEFSRNVRGGPGLLDPADRAEQRG